MKNEKTLTSYEMNFVGNLVMNGYSLEQALALIGKSTCETNAINRVVSNAKIEAPTTKAPEQKKTSTKGSKKSSSKEEKFGGIKVGDYFKQVNLKTKEIVKVAKAKVIKDNFVYTSDAEGAIGISQDNCVKLYKSDFLKLQKSLKKSDKKAKSDKVKLTPKDYKAVYALNLKNLGKITESDYNDIVKDDKKLSDTYQNFKDSVKLAHKDAVAMFEKNSQSESSK